MAVQKLGTGESDAYLKRFEINRILNAVLGDYRDLRLPEVMLLPDTTEKLKDDILKGYIYLKTLFGMETPRYEIVPEEEL